MEGKLDIKQTCQLLEIKERDGQWTLVLCGGDVAWGGTDVSDRPDAPALSNLKTEAVGFL